MLTIPVYRVSKGNIRDDILARRNTTGGRFSSIPWFTVNPDGTKGMGRRQCSSEYKLRPIMWKLRDLLGVSRRDRIRPESVEVLIGISTDEAHRMRPARQQWIRNRYPLIDAGMNRTSCDEWLFREYFRHAPKSSCIGCPFHNDDLWLKMQTESPDEFADAVAVDRALREGNARGMRSTEYMHNARVPLDQVNFRPSKDPRQFDLFGDECEGMCGV